MTSMSLPILIEPLAKGEDWKEIAAEYTKLSVKVASKPLAAILDSANTLLPFSEATSILDNGCGPGAVTGRLIEEYGLVVPKDCALLCTDFSEGMIDQVKATKAREADNPLWQRVEASISNAMDLVAINDGSQSHVLAGWVYFMTPDPKKCLSETMRVLKDGGVLVCSSWEGSQWMDLMFYPAKIRPDIKMPAMPVEWVTADAVRTELEKAGFRDVHSRRVPTEMGYESHEALADLLMKRMPHMIALLADWSASELAKLKTLIIEGVRGMCSEEPGVLNGMAIVAAGRK